MRVYRGETELLLPRVDGAGIKINSPREAMRAIHSLLTDIGVEENLLLDWAFKENSDGTLVTPDLVEVPDKYKPGDLIRLRNRRFLQDRHGQPKRRI